MINKHPQNAELLTEPAEKRFALYLNLATDPSSLKPFHAIRILESDHELIVMINLYHQIRST